MSERQAFPPMQRAEGARHGQAEAGVSERQAIPCERSVAEPRDVTENRQLSDTRLAFDGVAAEYDGPLGNNPLVQRMREKLWVAVAGLVHPGGRLLDLGCGTGLDAVHFGRAGYAVVATDWSPAMVERTNERIARAGLADRVRTAVVGIHELDRLRGEGFDAIYSNLGPLNCAPNPRAVAAACAELLPAGGLLVASVIGRACPWERMYFTLSGNLARARVRAASGAVPVPLRDGTIWTRYYAPDEFYQAFREDFDLVGYRALGLFVPPPYLIGLHEKLGPLGRVLEKLDDALGSRPLLRDRGDHFLMVLRRREAGFVLACPGCGATLVKDGERANCPDCGASYDRTDGIWDFLPPRRAARFAPFLDTYQTVRAREGWGSGEAAYYRTLPEVSPDDPLRQIWRVRAAAFRRFERRVLDPLAADQASPLKVLDLGAGNCWLSYRLAQGGHRVAAVDLSPDPTDGLGARRRYPEAGFAAMRAEFDRLPFADGQADLVVFNAALHYAEHYDLTMREALRVLRPEGTIAVLDTPVYRDASSGRSMLAERDRHHARQGIVPSPARQEGFLSWCRLDRLAREFDLEVQVIWPTAAWRRLLNRAKARLIAPREPASFPLLVLRRGAGPNPPLPLPGAGRGRPEGASNERSCQSRCSFDHDTNDGRSHPQAPPSRAREGGGGVRSGSPLHRLLRVAGRLVVRGRYLLFERHRHRRFVVERIGPWTIVVFPDVFNPKLFRTGAFLARTLDEILIPRGSSILDLGTGTGIGAIAAAAFTGRIVATDLNSEAIRCARANLAVNRVEDRVELRLGDLFAPVEGERFDVVLFNPPFFRGVPRDLFDHAWRSPDVAERFAAGLADHLTPTGHALVVLSSDGDPSGFRRAFLANGCAIDVVAQRHFLNETLTIYRVRPGKEVIDARRPVQSAE